MATSSKDVGRILLAAIAVAAGYGIYGVVNRDAAPAVQERTEPALPEAPPGAPARTAEPVLPAAAPVEPQRDVASRDETARAVRDREAFVPVFEQALFDRRLHPDSVTATGPDKTTIDIRGLVCPRDFLSGIGQSDVGEKARALGFKRLECTFEQMSVFQQL
jgi:hypothetical protein